jgi:hypothetical protein
MIESSGSPGNIGRPQQTTDHTQLRPPPGRRTPAVRANPITRADHACPVQVREPYSRPPRQHHLTAACRRCPLGASLAVQAGTRRAADRHRLEVLRLVIAIRSVQFDGERGLPSGGVGQPAPPRPHADVPHRPRTPVEHITCGT